MELAREKQKRIVLEEEGESRVEGKVEEMKERLIQRMREEVAVEVDGYIAEL